MSDMGEAWTYNPRCTCSAQGVIKESLLVWRGDHWICEGCLGLSTLCGRMITGDNLIRIRERERNKRKEIDE